MFVDECIVSRNTVKRLAYAATGTNIRYDRDKFEVKPIYAVVAVSAEHGLESIHVFNKSINSQMFALILPDIRTKGRDFALIGDSCNLSFMLDMIAGRKKGLDQS